MVCGVCVCVRMRVCVCGCERVGGRDRDTMRCKVQ